MTRSKRKLAGVLIAGLAVQAETETSVDGCPICGNTAKRSTGECGACGVYICNECDKMHYGEVRPCPGGGVPVPTKTEKTHE